MPIASQSSDRADMGRRIIRLAIAVAAAATTLAPQIGAQIPRMPRGGHSGANEPTFFASLWIGFHQLGIVQDGTTGSQWDFGTTAQYRATLEYGIGNESTLGVAGTYAKMPLVYSSLSGAGACSACDADAVVQSIEGFFHIGGRPGFHQV